MNTSEVGGAVAAIITLAALSVAIIHGNKTAKVIGAGANGFAKVLKAATLRG